ncbi:hypothetical protein X777_06664 [Ooceraea biroi]|uniref:Reverse transcriptase domain-containing protein n=1 Tax=Ooceraea biroi TaxID=2015173 RepID=A0A026WCV0_OOCBI|nr:hypothetical protein X777_06664 [Ooceraea biroi]
MGANTREPIHIKLKQDAKPQFRKPRQVPYALLPLVEEALDDMEQQGIITKIEHSEWATPIVSIKKPNGKVRICGDYKDTVNLATETVTYPLPIFERLLAGVSGCVKFSTLDY